MLREVYTANGIIRKEVYMNDTDWMKPLTRMDIIHLINEEITTLAKAKAVFADQEQMRKEAEHNPTLEPCWKCKDIRRKLKNAELL